MNMDPGLQIVLGYKTQKTRQFTETESQPEFPPDQSPKSPYRSTYLPNTHPSQKLFHAYNKAEPFIKHLNYNYKHQIGGVKDLSISKFQRFQNNSQRRNSQQFKPSYFPNSRISQQLQGRIEVINFYNSLSSHKKPKKKTKKPVITKRKRSYNSYARGVNCQKLIQAVNGKPVQRPSMYSINSIFGNQRRSSLKQRRRSVETTFLTGMRSAYRKAVALRTQSVHIQARKKQPSLQGSLCVQSTLINERNQT